MKIREKHEHTKREEETTLVFHQLKIMRFKHLPYLRGFYSGSCILEFPSLKELWIECCEKIFPTINAPTQHFFNKTVAFPSLEELYVKGMDELNNIWHTALQTESFSKLRVLVVESCGKLSSVGSLNLLQRLENLERLEISKCDSLEEVVFPGLKELYLISLFNLREIGIGSLPLHFIQILEVQNSGNLRNLFSSSIATTLERLEELIIESCEVMEEIVASEGVEEVINQIVFPQLQYLVLSNLPNLTRFCNANYALNLPSLRYARLKGCMKMQAFAFGQLTMPEIEIYGNYGELPWMGDLNMYVEQKVLKGEGLAVEEEEAKDDA
ncbi:hypothetical protein F0562_025028 [Nyssa sinensis]|uniref:Disease resistance protein At4g27190-like leucine-rich repeats domain-containing protein n=1 Tax=Nyssa sinensis TaxID=561372 RepID=A0A5J5BD07_9ASTE|nr:hypothetical protein F0562_025028 [Nyssa sinensis]